MPRTDDRCSIQFALAERAATVTAHVVDGVELSFNIEDADGFAVDVDALAAARLDLSGFADFDEISHSRIPFLWSAPKSSDKYTNLDLLFKRKRKMGAALPERELQRRRRSSTPCPSPKTPLRRSRARSDGRVAAK